MDEKIIARKIKELRKRRNLTLSEVSKNTGFSKGLLSKIENNQVSPPIATLSTSLSAIWQSILPPPLKSITVLIVGGSSE